MLDDGAGRRIEVLVETCCFLTGSRDTTVTVWDEALGQGTIRAATGEGLKVVGGTVTMGNNVAANAVTTGKPRASGRNFGARRPTVSPRSLLAWPQPGGRSRTMRRKFFISSIIPLLFLLMLGGCLGPDYLVTSSGPAAAG